MTSDVKEILGWIGLFVFFFICVPGIVVTGKWVNQTDCGTPAIGQSKPLWCK